MAFIILCQPFSPSVVKRAGDVGFEVWEDSFLAQDPIYFRTTTKSPPEHLPGEMEEYFRQITIFQRKQYIKKAFFSYYYEVTH